MIKILCDSITDLPVEIIDKYNIDVVPLTVIFNENEYLDKFSTSFVSEYSDVLRFVNDGFVKYENGAYCFTPKGFFVSNYILSQILKFN